MSGGLAAASGRVPAGGGRIVLVGGGARSGKSRFALELARARGPQRTFIATAEALDGEMRERARAHREERGVEFETVEEPLGLSQAISSADAAVVVVDCVTLWLSNLLVHGRTREDVLAAVDGLVAVLSQRERTVVLVTNEVGMGIVPETPLGRLFRDLSGVAHQRIAAAADEVYLGALGLILRLKPGPVEVACPG